MSGDMTLRLMSNNILDDRPRMIPDYHTDADDRLIPAVERNDIMRLKNVLIVGKHI